MKRPLLLFLLLLAVVLQASATFVPTPGTKYNIIQHASGRVIGADGTQPCVQDLNNRPSQAFEFVSVPGMDNRYYLVNEDGYYLNKLNVDAWTTGFESAPNGENSEWIIVGEQDTFRLQLAVNMKYLASDNTGTGSPLYCDKTDDNPRGTFTVQEAEVVYEVFDLSERNVRLHIERNHKPYPITISCSGFWDPVKVWTPEGYTVNKSEFTPEEFAEAGGKMTLEISSSAEVGNQSALYFYIGEWEDEIVFDSIPVATVEVQPRYFIKNNANHLFVIGSHATLPVPALNMNEGKPSQQFIMRAVNLGVDDSLYYFVQDDGYRFMRKVPSSGWDVDFGAAFDEAIWKVIPIAENSDTVGLFNTITGKYLGVDNVAENSRLYDDKAWVEDPTMKPYTQWVIVRADEEAVPEVYSQPISQRFELEIESNYQAYPFSFRASGFKENLHVVTTAGFEVDQSTFTPDEVKALDGKVTVRISTQLEAGMDGKLYVSKGAQPGETMLDTVNLVAVDKYPRVHILNNFNLDVYPETLVLGNHPEDGRPGLVVDRDTITQMFFLRKARPELPEEQADLMDSVYFIVQDGDYRMLAKDPSNNWGTQWSVPSDEAMWYIIPHEEGIYEIVNYVTNKALGTDAVTEGGGDWLYCDKVFTPAPIDKPFCEWKIVEAHPVSVPVVTDGSTLTVTITGGQVTLYGTKVGERILVYNLAGRCVQQLTAASSQTPLNLIPGFYLVKSSNVVLKVVF